MDDGHPIIRIVIFIILLLIDAAFTGTEVAVSAVNESVLTKKKEEGDSRAARILRFVGQPAAFMSTIDLIGAAVTIIAGAFVARPFFTDLTFLLMTQARLMYWPAAVISHLLVCLIIIYFVTVFGILFPKRLAFKYAEKWAYSAIRIVTLISTLCRPFVALINGSVGLLVRLAGINPKDIEENVTEEEIIMMVSEGHEQGVIEASEAEMISNIFKFDDKEVSDIMTHRRHICAVDCSLSLSEAAEIMARERYSRYPVFENDTDNIIGILHLKDVMRLIVSGETDTSIKEVMRKPVFVPDTQNINSLFREMQAKKMHMAIVVDDYGQSCGLVAMEDILEEIVGNILDEYDPDEDNIQIIGGAYLMKGLTPLEDITRTLGITFDDNFETLNGLLISKLEHIPQNNEFASIDIDGYTFKVMNVKDNAISLVKVTKITG